MLLFVEADWYGCVDAGRGREASGDLQGATGDQGRGDQDREGFWSWLDEGGQGCQQEEINALSSNSSFIPSRWSVDSSLLTKEQFEILIMFSEFYNV